MGDGSIIIMMMLPTTPIPLQILPQIIPLNLPPPNIHKMIPCRLRFLPFLRILPRFCHHLPLLLPLLLQPPPILRHLPQHLPLLLLRKLILGFVLLLVFCEVGLEVAALVLDEDGAETLAKVLFVDLALAGFFGVVIAAAAAAVTPALASGGGAAGV
jgi:hypothetical protein